MTILKSQRLLLREATVEDSEFILQLMNEPAWREFIASHSITNTEKAAEYIKNRLIAMYSQLGFGLWVVETKKGGEPVGLCGLIKRPWLTSVDLGFAFLESHWGNGFAYEAATACLKYACRHIKTKQVAAITVPHNARSIKVLEKIGFYYLSNCTNPDTAELLSLYEYECKPVNPLLRFKL